MAVITIPGMFLTGDHASRPAATAVGDGTLYSCSTHSLIYQSDGASWSTWATLGGGATLATDRVVKTSDFNTTSSTFVDVTGLSLTIATGAHRVLCGFGGSGYNSSTSGAVILTVSVDGTDQVDTANGIVFDKQISTANENKNLSFTFMSDVLSAASHTFKVRMHRGSAGTGTLSGAGPGCIFWVAEQAS